MNFRDYFEIPLNPVAVIFRKEEMDAEGEYRFCEAVRIVAEHGERIVINEFNLMCAGALVSLGFVTEMAEEGETRSIVLEPYRGQECDVVLVVATPDRIMRISSYYKNLFDEELKAQFAGETAVCGEATARVRDTGEPNISFLCPGAREIGNYRREEVVIGFPKDVFVRIETAIRKQEVKALCGCLMDDLPKDLIERFEQMGFDKSTDHFFGFVSGKSVKLYIFKGEKNTLGIYTSVKFKSEEEAERVAESYAGEYVLMPRENWIEIMKVSDIDVFQEYRKPDFEKRLNSEIEKIVEEARRIKGLKARA
ncbi:DUF169 domain-containing protein [Geoglobus acetivorans]|uniref:DUF169 domain-containing protein n=1 Tax=Geoglobus acetivorans TaxID=565033 RepID=A0ABZ3H580_GEOAI|nr:DUF169 domain-containing protein [Geoglobus acetivorans]